MRLPEFRNWSRRLIAACISNIGAIDLVEYPYYLLRSLYEIPMNIRFALFVAIALVSNIRAANNTDITKVLPEGTYQIIYSPAKPDPKNLNSSPDSMMVKVHYKEGKPYLTGWKSEVPVYYRQNTITFTLPPSNNPSEWFETGVFSASQSSPNHPGTFVGRLWTIQGYPGGDSAEECIFKMQPVSEVMKD
jgi:hypothetical protein